MSERKQSSRKRRASDMEEDAGTPDTNRAGRTTRSMAKRIDMKSMPGRSPSANIDLQRPIEANKLPTVLSCFCSSSLVTRELMFNFGRFSTIEAVRSLVNQYFAWEFMRLGLPTTIRFMGLNCFYPNKPSDPEGDEYWTISTEEEYQQWYAEIAGAQARTGQIVRIQVCLMTEEQEREQERSFAEWFDKDPAEQISGPKWKLEEMEKQHERKAQNKLLTDPRLFEMDADDMEVISVPAHTWREAAEKANQYDKLDQKYHDLLNDKRSERGKVKQLLSDQADEIRGLKELLRDKTKNITAEDVRDTTLYNRVLQRDPPHPDGRLSAI